MSAYLTLMTPMTDRECLLAALSDLGFGQQKVEVHDVPVHLMGYQGDTRTQLANIVIRRQHVGSGSNDIGFLASATGYQSNVSQYDLLKYGNHWMQQLNTRYKIHEAAKHERLAEEERRRLEEERKRLIEAQRRTIHEKAAKMGYQIKESNEGGTLRIVLIKRTY